MTYISRYSPLCLTLLILVAAVNQSHSFAADNGLTGYDEAADIAELALLENENMHFILMHSRVTDKPGLWQSYQAELADFGDSEYQALKPLILEKSVPELQDSVAAGEFDYATLLTFYLYRVRQIETDSTRFLNAVIAINPDALEAAQARDRQRQQGLQVSRESLFGIPVLLKDNIGAAGLPTTAGAVALQQNVAGDAFITQQLLENGAVIMGKTNLSEWAYFFCDDCPSGYSALGGQTLNPYGRKKFGTGGSSSGSGASAAANLASVTVGSETSGSILSPASANSLVGLKPTTGSLSRTGIVPISATLDTAGPMTKTVVDAVILFNAMAGFDEADKAMPLLTQGLQLSITDVSLQGTRFGVLNSFAGNAFYQDGIELITANGGVPVPLEFSPPNFSGFDQFLGAEMVRDLARYLESHAGDQVQLDSVAQIRSFNKEDEDSRAPYGQALFDMMSELDLDAEATEALRIKLQDQASGYLDSLFADQQLDVLLSVNNRNAGLAALANYPALTIPMGYEDDGKPIGMTLIAPSFMEQRLVDVGLQFEKFSQARRLPVGYD